MGVVCPLTHMIMATDQWSNANAQVDTVTVWKVESAIELIIQKSNLSIVSEISDRLFCTRSHSRRTFRIEGHCSMFQIWLDPVDTIYCRTGFDSDGLTATEIATKMLAIVGICYRNDAHYTLYRNCLPTYGIAIIRSLPFLFLDDFEGNTNISVAIRSSFIVRV